MTFDGYAQWLSRGRAHQTAGRPIDALLCYRRALREAPHGIDAQFHVGEIAWHMGNHADAIAAWRSAVANSPEHLATWNALADALAENGELVASRDAIAHVLTLQPDQRRARRLDVLLSAAMSEVSDDAVAGAVSARRSWPLPLLAGVIAHRLGFGAQRSARSLPALLDAAIGSVVTRGNADALRRIALALSQAACTSDAQRFADHYADACRSLHRPAMPMLWPCRTAGDALRVGLLITADGDDEARAFRTLLDNAGLGASVDCITLIGPDAMPAPSAGDGNVPPAARDVAARGIAMLDLDVMIDLAGVRLASGSLLALHPARAVWVIERPGIAFARPLADRVFDIAAGERWQGALRDAHASLARARTSPVAAAQLASIWQDAVIAHEKGDLEAARAGYTRVLDVQPAHAPARYLSGVIARSEGGASTALAHFRAAVDEAPAYGDARVALVTSLVDAGAADEAAAIARRGLELAPDATSLWRALGQAELARGDAGAAISAFEAALVRDPGDGEAHYNHGVALQTTRRLGDAARAYQRALAFRPDLHAADFNLGVIFDQQGNADAAISAFSNVLSRAPDHVAASKALAETLLASGRMDAWFANFDRFEQHRPRHLMLAVHALEVCAYRGDFARLERYLDGLRHGRFTADRADETLDALQQLLYLLHFFDVEPDLFVRYARTHDALARTLYGEPWPRREARRPGKLRIGYLSGDFRNHVMGKMILEVLSRHDRDRFEVLGYATNDARDDWTPRFESVFARFESLAVVTDAAAARRIADDDLDVLVDLSTHTKGARPGILARRPARVAITHVASAGTLAMSAIDFKLTDRLADLARDPDTEIERLLVMEGCVYPYRHVAPSAAATMTLEALRIPASAIVIGAFCTPLKLSQRCLALWREVLARIPQALLAFSPVHPGLRSVYRRLAERVDIDPRRLIFIPQGRDDAQNQARYRVIDFVLDPMPYGGVNGTLEALDMGVPVVTLIGQRHAERTSLSILANLGVRETIAQTGGEYVDIAARLATDRAFMHAVRARIADGLRHSPLTDMDAHVRHLEAAYVHALERATEPGARSPA